MCEPPIGWPEKIPWNNFSGASRSKLTNCQTTENILSLLRAADINPATHIHRDQTVQDSNANEGGSDVVALDNNSDALVLIDNTAGDNNENNIQVNISDVDGAIGEHEKKRKIWV